MILQNLDNEKYNLFCNDIQDSEDMEQFKKDLNLDKDITGLTGIIQDGEIIELWCTYSSRPFDTNVDYQRIR